MKKISQREYLEDYQFKQLKFKYSRDPKQSRLQSSGEYNNGNTSTTVAKVVSEHENIKKMNRQTAQLSLRKQTIQEKVEQNDLSFKQQKNEVIKQPPENIDNVLIENGRNTYILYHRLFIVEQGIALLTIQGLFVNVVQYEIDYSAESPESAMMLQTFMMILQLVQLFFLIIRYYLVSQLEQQRFVIQLKTESIKYFLIELCLILIQPYPFFDYIEFYVDATINYEYKEIKMKLNWFLTIGMWLKSFNLMRFNLMQKGYLCNRMNRLSKMFGPTFDYQFAVKCYFRNESITFALTVLTFFIFIFSYTIRILERQVWSFVTSQGQTDYLNYNSFFNCVWFNIITMTTVGYGDFYPRTSFGRFCNFFISLFGMSITSMIVSILTDFIVMDKSENRVLKILNRLKMKEELKKKASLYITITTKYLYKQKIKKYLSQSQKKKKSQVFYLDDIRAQQKIKILSQMKQQSYELKKQIRIFRNMNDNDDVYGEMLRYFDMIREQVKQLSISQNSMDQFINNKIENIEDRICNAYELALQVLFHNDSDDRSIREESSDLNESSSDSILSQK